MLDIYGAVCNRVLLYAQTAMPEWQFEAFRKLVLNEFGEQGASRKIKRLFRVGDGMERDGSS